jgi:hypothetical protein
VKRTSITLAIVLNVGAVGAIVACGTSKPPPAGDDHGTSGGTSGSFGTGTGKPAGCGVDQTGAFCDCVDVPLVAQPPNIYYVLDRSGSMSHDNKWTNARDAVTSLTKSLGSHANFGAAIFPTGDDTCGPGVEVMSVRPGDPIAPNDPNAKTPTADALFESMLIPPQGGTPTAATLQYVLGRVQPLKSKTYVVLVTDGAPNCNAAATCTADLCSDNIAMVSGCPAGGPPNCCAPPNGANCIDSDLSAKAVSDLAAAGFPTYVIGLATSAMESDVLDKLAVAGGTANTSGPTKYYLANDVTTEGLLGTLRKVAGRIAGACVQKLMAPPMDPSLVNVYVDDVVVPQDPVNGWALQGDTVTLLGTTCSRVESGDALDVRIIAGCPTVKPR